MAALSLFSVSDGFDATDDPYATADDSLTESFGSALDSQYTFEASSADTYCLQLNGPSSRSQTFLVQGEIVTDVGTFQPYTVTTGGNDWTLQVFGGTTTQCRFNLWKNKACGAWNNTHLGEGYPAGCGPDESNINLDEGVTDTYTVGGDSIDITCLAAGQHNYAKCQAPTSADLSACISSSLDGDGSGDGLRLYEACLDSTSAGVDTTAECDVQAGNTWELATFSSDALATQKQLVYLAGMPNQSFTLYGYTGCGTGAFARTSVATVNLTQFTGRERACNASAYAVEGVVQGYMPWWGGAPYVNASYAYGANSCSLGYVCEDHAIEASEFDPDLLACFTQAGASCYDGTRNQDETAIDYGGVCGACANASTPKDDVYWVVARAQFSSGYFNVANPFNATTYCSQGEDATNGAIGFVALLVTIIFGVLVLALVAFVTYIVVNVVFATRLVKGLFARREKKKAYKRGGL